jgi:O-antigen/teichoic acid export membrane protein
MKLMSGRMAAFAITFLTPVLLVRLFSQSEFGTYKQFMLITFTPYLIGCAFSECLFYFLPKDPVRGGRYAVNAMMMLFVTGVVSLVAMMLRPSWVAGLVSNPALEPYVPLMGLYLLFTLMGTALEITMISMKRYNLAAGTYVVSDVFRAAFLVVPALLTRNLRWALIGSVVFFAIRVCAALVYFRWEFGTGVRFDKPLLREQWSYAAPYSLAGIVSVIQQNYHQYAVAFHFDAATFAIYSVGCLQIPLVDFMATPTSNVMMVRMAERLRVGDIRSLLPIWHDTTRKLALLFFPFVALLLIDARQIITLLFTTAYAASVPIFMVWCLSILMAAFQTDGVLRTFAQIRYMFVTNVARLIMLVVSMGWFLSRFGLMGAVMITLAGTLLSKIMALMRIRRVLQTSYVELLPWKSLGATLIAAMGAATPSLIVNASFNFPTLLLLPISGMIYAASYAALLLILGVPTKDEIGSLKKLLAAPCGVQNV